MAKIWLRIVVSIVTVLGSLVVVRLACAACGVWTPDSTEAMALFMSGLLAVVISAAIPDLATAAKSAAAGGGKDGAKSDG